MYQGKSVVAAMLWLTGGVALAQTQVAVYGLVDVGVGYQTNAAPDKSSQTRVNSGSLATSRLGFRGNEDLGGGYSALFRLETGFRADTGALEESGTLFSRQANVGVAGPFGSIIAGRSFSTTLDFIAPYDPMISSHKYSWALASGMANGRRDGMLIGSSNMLKYQGDFGHFKFGATYGFGETAGSNMVNARHAIGAGYTKGRFSMAVTMDRANGPLIAGAYERASSTHIAGGYQVSDKWLLNAGYRRYQKQQTGSLPDLRSNLFWGGGSYQLAPAWTLIGALYYQDLKTAQPGTESDPVMYALRLKYALSKRSELYGTAAYARAKNGQMVSLSRDEVGYGSTQAGLAFGMLHRF